MMSPASWPTFLAIPSPTSTTRGRLFSIALRRRSAACASAAPVNSTWTRGSVHDTSACARASHLAFQSPLMAGGFTAPEHRGSSILTEQPPVQVPGQAAASEAWQRPPHFPLHVPFMWPEHVPSHSPAHFPPDAAGIALPSHVPLHAPSQCPAILASHVPLQSPEQA